MYIYSSQTRFRVNRTAVPHLVGREQPVVDAAHLAEHEGQRGVEQVVREVKQLDLPDEVRVKDLSGEYAERGKKYAYSIPIWPGL